MLAATIEMNAFKDEYQSQVLSNARAFAKACASEGIPWKEENRTAIANPSGYHWFDIFRGMPRCVPVGGKQYHHELPGASGRRNFLSPERHPDGSSGNDPIWHEGAGFLQPGALHRGRSAAKETVASDVAEFRTRFQTMQYCLDAEQTKRIVPRICESIFFPETNSSKVPP